MKRTGWLLMMVACMACNSSDTNTEEGAGGYNYQKMVAAFATAPLPWELTETQLISGSDADTLPSSFMQPYFADSLRKLAGTGKIRYVPLARFEKEGAETYFVVKTVTPRRKAAFVLVFNKEQQFAAALPFLVPDDDFTTTQTSTIDKSFSVSRNIVRKKGLEVLGEGKDVFAYDAAANRFSWVVTDPLDEGELINPVDTLAKTHRLSGDYVLDKKNIVSVRDGRYPNQLVVFVHFEKGECKGELKGDLLITSSKTAVYRQPGDPCILQFTFSASSVTLREEQGCGNYRDVDCTFAGTFPKKKANSSSKNKRTGK